MMLPLFVGCVRNVAVGGEMGARRGACAPGSRNMGQYWRLRSAVIRRLKHNRIIWSSGACSIRDVTV